MATIYEVKRLLAEKGGRPRPELDRHAATLARAKLLPPSQAGRGGVRSPEIDAAQAITLLISVLGASSPGDGPRAVRRLSDLPLLYVSVVGRDAAGDFGERDLPASDRRSILVRTAYGTLAPALTQMVHEIAFLGDQPGCPVHHITVGGDRGTSAAMITLSFWGRFVKLRYGLPGAVGELPDDAPSCRIDRSATVPGEILKCFGRLFGCGPVTYVATPEQMAAMADTARASRQPVEGRA